MSGANEEPAEPAKRDDAPPLPRVFRKWMLWALLAGLAFGGSGFGIWWHFHETWERPPPPINPCFQGLSGRLKRPVIVAPSEPYTVDGGETFYLTDAQNRVAGCAARLPGRVDFDLVRIWGKEGDPDAQIGALRELVTSVPQDASYDYQAHARWRLAQGSLGALPESPAREDALRDIDGVIGCRFSHPRLPACAARPGFPVHAAILGGIGALALSVLLGGLAFFTFKNIQARRARRRASAPRLDPVPSDR